MIPYGRQSIDEADIAAVEAVLRSDFLTQGPAVPRFESALAAVCGARDVVAVSSATSALHLACLALGLGPGDRLWTSPNSFVASANCARLCGAEVDFVDIDPATLNLCPRQLADRLDEAARQGRLPKIVVPVHFGGQPCDLAPIAELAERYGFSILEDAAHALGARYRGTRIGDGRYSQAAVFSFHPVKLVASGEGGAIACRDAALAGRLRQLRTHGITRDAGLMAAPDAGPWCYEQQMLGINARLSDLHAALGASQLRRIDAFLARRRALAQRYDEALADWPLARPRQLPQTESAWHLYVVRLRAEQRRAVFERMREAGIGVNVHYMPIHLQPYYRALGFRHGDFPNAEHYYAEALTLPLYPDLDEARQDQVLAALRRALS